MLTFIRKIYNKYVGSKFLNKIQFVYFAMVLLAVILLTALVSSNIETILKEQALNYNTQILITIDRYFEEQCRNAKDIHQMILQEEDNYTDIIQLLDSQKNRDEVDIISLRSNISSSMRAKLNIYSDIKHIYLYDLENNYYPFYLSSDEPPESTYSAAFLALARSRSVPERGTERLFVSPSIAAGEFNYFCMYDYLRDKKDLVSIKGALLYDYDVSSIKESYSMFEQYLLGDVLVLTNEGDVIYDSSGTNYGEKFPMFSAVSQVKNHVKTFYDDGFMNAVRNSTFDFISVGKIPYSELYKDINSTKRRIYFIAFMCIAGILVITFFSTKVLSQRINAVISSIHQIQQGDFNPRIEVTAKDEIGEISQNLNNMCEQIKEYINKEYIAERRIRQAELKQRELELKQNQAMLSQKNAELIALQSQINPHFLYNTLEVIRMNALSSGESEAGQMLEALATLFRCNIKDDMVVSIKDEMIYCNSYLKLFNIRFAGMIRFEFDIAEDIQNYGIIRHLVQPFIENAIVHAFDLTQEDNIIKVKGVKDKNAVRIEISDNGKGMSEDEVAEVNRQLHSSALHTGEKLGIANVNSRIKLLYGMEYGVEIHSTENVGTKAIITVSAKTKEELMNYV